MRLKLVSISLACLGIAGCNSLGNLTGFGTDNTPPPAPLVKFEAEQQPQQLWSVRSGAGVGKQHLPLYPVVAADKLVVAHHDGKVVAHRLTDGSASWQASLRSPISANPALVGKQLVVGMVDGNLALLDAATGAINKTIAINNKAVAITPLGNDRVIVKTVDGEVIAVSLTKEETLWRYQHGAPTLVLRGGSRPRVVNNEVLIGFADGKFVALNASNGKLLWERLMALPKGASIVEQMVDINVDPVIVGDMAYVVSYQGNLAAINTHSGETKWQIPFSSHTGMAVQRNTLYAVNDDDEIWSVNRPNGQVNWRQVDFAARDITAPAIIDDMLVVGDKEGYLHWLATKDGHHIARIQATGDAIIARPVVHNNTVYVLTASGRVAAFKL